MNAGNLYRGCRQWPLWEALLARLEASHDGRGSMTSLEGIECLRAAGVITCDIRDDFGTIRKHAPEFGYELLPAESVNIEGTRCYRYVLRFNPLAVAGGNDIQPDAAPREAAEPVGALAPAGAPRPGQLALFGGGRA